MEHVQTDDGTLICNPMILLENASHAPRKFWEQQKISQVEKIESLTVT